MNPSHSPLPLAPRIQRLLLLRRALRLVWQSSPGWTLASLTLLVLQGLLPLASLYLLKLIVDAVTAALQSSQPDFHPTLLLILVMGAVTLAGALVASLALFGLLFSLHWIVAALLLLAALPGLFVRLRYSQQLYAWQRRRTSTERMSWVHPMAAHRRMACQGSPPL